MNGFENLISDKVKLDFLIQEWLNEDLPSFDIGGFVVGSEKKEAILLGKSPGIIAHPRNSINNRKCKPYSNW